MKCFLCSVIIVIVLFSVSYHRDRSSFFGGISSFQDPYQTIKEQIDGELGKTGFLFEESRKNLLINQILAIYLLEKGKYEDYALIAMQQNPQDYLTWDNFCKLQQSFSILAKKVEPIALNEFLKKVLIISLLKDKIEQEKLVDTLSELEQCLLLTIISSQDLEKISSLDEGVMAFQHYKDGILCDCYFDHIDFYFLTAIIQSTCETDENYCYPFIACTDNFHAALQRAKQVSLLMRKMEYDTAYQSYIAQQAESLNLDKDNPFHSVITKLSIMMHFFDKQQAFLIADALLDLKNDDLAIIIELFNKEQSVADLKHFSLFLRKLLKNQAMGVKKNDRILTTLKVALPILVGAYRQQQAFSHQNHLLSKMEFSEMVKIVDNDPDALLKYRTDMKDDGVICLRK